MDNRTTDPVKIAIELFFEDQGLDQAVTDFFESQSVKQLLLKGFAAYQNILDEAKTTAPEGLEELAAKVAEKLSMTEEDYVKDVLEKFKEKLENIFHPVTIYISIKEQLIQLLSNQDNENLKELVMSAMDENTEGVANKFCNIIRLLVEGVPMEIAEEIADEVGDAEVIPIKVETKIVHDDDDDDGEECTS